jgi:leukotriene-A4 hydrolase
MYLKILRTLALAIFLPTIIFAADPHSYSEPEKIQIKNLDLDLHVDAEKQTLSGTAILTLDQKDPNANLVLDTKDLKIEKIESKSTNGKWYAIKYSLGNTDPILGEKLEIILPKNKFEKTVKITYAATPNSQALQWNTPEQTLSKRPFLIVNNQPINARTWIPLQDTPVVRMTYNARIQVAQNDLMAVMSSNNNPTKINPKGKYEFKMNIPVPSYLVALAVGKLEFKSTGLRTGVYAEPEMLEKAAAEFSETEKMILAAEKMYGKYVWGRYDLLVLPASFPWGGMEYPKLTFVSPTLITGKKDLVDVVAHEIAHSWSGNLVTNASWNDLWINEGFTTYVQYRIIEELHNTATRMRDMVLDKNALEEYLNDKETLAEDTRLRPDFSGRNPDEGFTDVPYTKGALMLYSIEEKVGKPTFDNFLKTYFAKYTFKSISTDQVIEELSKIVDKTFLTEWIDKPGLPKNVASIESTMIDKIDMMVKTFKLTGGAPGKKDIETMTSKDICYYLQALPRKPSIYKLDFIDSVFLFSSTPDPEVRTLWYKLTLPRDHKKSLATVPEFLSGVGRGKFVIPTFTALTETKKGKKLAGSIYEKNKMFYSPGVRERVEKKIYKTKDK